MYTKNNRLCCGQMKFVEEILPCIRSTCILKKYTGFQIYTPFFTSYNHLALIWLSYYGYTNNSTTKLQTLLEFKTVALHHARFQRQTSKYSISVFDYIKCIRFYKVGNNYYLCLLCSILKLELCLPSNIFSDWIVGNQFKAQTRIIWNNN